MRFKLESANGFEVGPATSTEATRQRRQTAEPDFFEGRRMLIVGLTGSIGTGKSTTAALFRQCGTPVFDADKCVHHLYDGLALEVLGKRFPEALVGERIDRNILAGIVRDKPAALKELEAIVHPLVYRRRDEFLAAHRQAGAHAVLLDIPLLFETGASRSVDLIIVVSAPMALQRQRVLARPGMTEQKFDSLAKAQLPDEEKRKQAHFTILTEHGLEYADRQVNLFQKAMSQIDPF
ncbi:dephospho-CoA kinase [Rhodoblastus sp.]|uniref:dephospho-CoA kinase n=1 Tax=Rhodoblastus sp. TaxID=1962975 RepID=UPI0031452573